MEDAFTLIVLTLLQLCRAEISKPLPEWYAANLINDASYTPKPLTEIFTTDLTFIPKDEFSQTTTTTTTTKPTTTSPATSEPTTIQNEDTTAQVFQQNIPFEVVQLSQPQQPILFSQTASRPFNSDPTRFYIIFNQRQESTQTPFTVEEIKVTASPSTTQMPETVSQQTTVNPNVGMPIYIPVSPINQMPLPNSTLFTQLNGPVAQTTDIPAIRKASQNPIITVRMKSPRGTITNILINPSTTRKPITTRRRRTNQRRNNYETCLNSCKDKREPICASPKDIIPINPDKLKGFPSLCHMACHNSFRSDQGYDKVSDGRCGRLRTRIRPVDKNKLNREELNKAQYTILHNGPETVMEFSPLSPLI